MIKGRDLLWVNSKDLTKIYLYRYDPNANPKWIPIPFQIDKRRKVNFIHNVSNPPDATDSSVCALSYFPPRYCAGWTGPGIDGTVRECPNNYGTPFQSNILGPTDEVVFMARDLGTSRDEPPYEWLSTSGDLGQERLEIMVPDDADGDGTIEAGEQFWVYAYEWVNPPPSDMKSNAPPPTWTPDQGACGPCSGQQAGNNVFHEDCGTFRGASSAVEGYELHTRSNWQYDDFRVIPAGSSTPNPDVLHNWGMSTPGETNYSWDCMGYPRPMDVKIPGPGQVRGIRGIQGSASGAATMKNDKAYESVHEMEVELRVHPLTWLFLKQGHNQAVKNGTDGAIWAKSVKDAQGIKIWDAIDGSYPPLNPGDPTPQSDDWWQMIHRTLGGVASFTFEDPSRGPIQSASRSALYQDSGSEPYGEFGRSWTTLACMQDGRYHGFEINDGGCPAGSDPESPELLFKRLVRVTIPTAPGDETVADSVHADELEFAVRHPLISGTSDRQSQGGGGGPSPFCAVELASSSNLDGSVSLDPRIPTIGGCDDTAETFGLTAQAGTGPETVIGYVPSGSTYRFRNVALGTSYTFRAFAIAADGRVSAKSAPVTVTPTDTTAPPPPLVVSVTGITSGVTIETNPCTDPGAFSIKVYVSFASGGPYTQANLDPIYVGNSNTFTISGLINNRTYYGVLTLTDLAGNESAYTPQFTFTTGP